MLLVSVVEINDHGTTSCYRHLMGCVNGYRNHQRGMIEKGYIESVYLLQVHAGMNSHLNFV